MSWRVAAGAIVAVACAACAPTLPPTSLTQAEQMPHAPAVLAARQAAPIAHAQADKLRRQARAAFDAGDFAGAQILAEQALAAYDEAVAEARVARAQDAAVRSEDDAHQARERLATIDAQQQQLEAEVAALDKQIQVLKALELPGGSGEADAERARARAAATRTLRLQAQLLCTAASLVAGPPSVQGAPPEAELQAQKALSDARAAVTALDELLRTPSDQPPIEHAMRARASCLTAVTLARRAKADVTRAPGSSDALLSALGTAGAGAPSRDDRGVVVTLRDLFSGDALAPASGATLDKLSKVIAKHGGVPLMVVLHQQKPLDEAGRRRAHSRGAALVAALRQRFGKAAVSDAVLAGDSAPLVDPAGKHRARNERVEIVFVTPEA